MNPESKNPDIYELNPAELKDSKIPEHVEETVRNFDHLYIKKQFQDIADKSGKDTEVSYLSTIGTDEYMDKYAAYSSLNFGEITMNQKEIAKRSQETGVNPKLLTLIFFIHEQNHNITDTPCAPRQGVIHRQKVGYSYQVIERKNDGTVTGYGAFSFFNEGVTEKIARELTIQYLVDHPTIADKNDIESFKKLYSEPNAFNLYEFNIVLVDLVIDRISQKTGVSRDTVWGSIKRGQFDWEIFSDKELHEMLSEALGENFVKKLAELDVDGSEKEAMGLMTSLVENGERTDADARLIQLLRQLPDDPSDE